MQEMRNLPNVAESQPNNELHGFGHFHYKTYSSENEMGLFAGLDPKLSVEQTGYFKGTEDWTEHARELKFSNECDKLDARYPSMRERFSWRYWKESFRLLRDVKLRTAFVPEEMELGNE